MGLKFHSFSYYDSFIVLIEILAILLLNLLLLLGQDQSNILLTEKVQKLNLDYY